MNVVSEVLAHQRTQQIVPRNWGNPATSEHVHRPHVTLPRRVRTYERLCERLFDFAAKVVNASALHDSPRMLHLRGVVPHSTQSVELREDKVRSEFPWPILICD